MTKPYFNHAVIGNSSMLGCLSDHGELIRLFWPNIDYAQHIDKFKVGVFIEGQDRGTKWLDEDYFQHDQSYVPDTNILETSYKNVEKGLYILQKDYVLPEQDILVRSYTIENTGREELELGFMLHASFMTNNHNLRSVLFDEHCDALVAYHHDAYLSFFSTHPVYQFQLGNNSMEASKNGNLYGVDSIGMMSDASLSWKLGKMSPGTSIQFTMMICATKTIKGLKKMTIEAKQKEPVALYENTVKHWSDFIRAARQVKTGNKKLDMLYKRSLLVFQLMADKKTGGLLASPEIDEEFTRCGRYGYCWGRDAAFITSALDQCGMKHAVLQFYEWAKDTQDQNGSWYQRYHLDGNLAPSWGLQIDETGSLIWGILKHYEKMRDKHFLKQMWDSVESAVKFMLKFTDKDTGLPRPSYDLWEERFGEHAYSSAAVYGGIIAGARIAEILAKPVELVAHWKTAAEELKKAIEVQFWRQHHNCFLRSVRTKLNPWGNEPSEHTVMMEVNTKGMKRDFTLEDGTIDVSLLGMTVPFGVFDVYDDRMEKTLKAIENVLTIHPVGGIKRYESDQYIGGNPWIIATLWVALFHIKKKNYKKAKEYLFWAADGSTDLGLLPEQIDKNTGKPAWVIPLTWSHAMFVLVLLELIDVGELGSLEPDKG